MRAGIHSRRGGGGSPGATIGSPVPWFALFLLLPEKNQALLILCPLMAIGLGPLIVGMLSDLSLPMLGGESLRYAVLIVSFISPWSAYHFRWGEP